MNEWMKSTSISDQNKRAWPPSVHVAIWDFFIVPDVENENKRETGKADFSFTAKVPSFFCVFVWNINSRRSRETPVPREMAGSVSTCDPIDFPLLPPSGPSPPPRRGYFWRQETRTGARTATGNYVIFQMALMGNTLLLPGVKRRQEMKL